MDVLRSKFDTRPATRHLIALVGLLALVCSGFSAGAAAQEEVAGRPLAAVIDEYVRTGLGSNLGLRAQSLEVERAEAALDAARARYFPEASLEARYSHSDGGRTIELPLGAALNPVYQT